MGLTVTSNRAILLAGMSLIIFVIIIALIADIPRHALPDHNRDRSLEGLSGEVEIIRTPEGIPHIFASSFEDLLFAQGFVHAQDHMFTMDFYRRIARGELAALVGGSGGVLDSDILMRTMNIKGLAERDFAALGSREKGALRAFAAGVNAYLSERSADEAAFEYVLLSFLDGDTTIAPWRPEDSLAVGKLMGFALSGKDYKKELQRAALLDALGPEGFTLAYPLYDAERHPYVLSNQKGDKHNDRLGPVTPKVQVAKHNPFLAKLGFFSDGAGSNAWVLAGSRTKSGQAMLAFDPHAGIEIPSLWHEIGLHLRGEESADIYGFAASPLPMIFEGKNRNIAWGTTNITGGDTLDLFEIKPSADEKFYIVDGIARPFTVRQETIRVAGGDDVLTQLRSTVFGPILPQQGEDGPLYAASWTGSAPSRIVEASLSLPFADNFDTFRSALKPWDVPGTTFLFAGRDGTIGLQQAGRFPIREAGQSGLTPQKGDREAALWQGTIGTTELPFSENPSDGFIVSANNPPVSEDWFAALDAQFAGDTNYLRDAARGFRAKRITSLLEEQHLHDTATVSRVQLDTTVPEISEALEFAASDLGGSPCAGQLLIWEGSFGTQSAEALIFAELWERLLAEVIAPHLPAESTTDIGMTELSSLLLLLEDAAHPFWNDPDTDEIELRSDRLGEMLDHVCTEIESRYGTDLEKWRWAAEHHAHFIAPVLGQSGIGPIEAMANKTVTVPGGAATVNMGRWRRGSGFNAVHISAYRAIFDWGDPETFHAVNAVGQSSHIKSPHYADQMHDWAEGRYGHRVLNEGSIRAEAASSMVLFPQSAEN